MIKYIQIASGILNILNMQEEKKTHYAYFSNYCLNKNFLKKREKEIVPGL